MTVRSKILKSYSEWTTLSALRSGAPIRSRKDIYGLIAKVNFEVALDESRGRIGRKEFDIWHRRALEKVLRAHLKMVGQYGWGAKILNVYLKTFCYVGDGGREGIRDCLHPPIDSGLWKGIRREFKHERHILTDTHSVTSIAAIDSYKKYKKIIKGLKAAAKKLDCSLIEVEQLWENA